jgi:hypothetical protein
LNSRTTPTTSIAAPNTPTGTRIPVRLDGVTFAEGLETFAVMPTPFAPVPSRAPRLAPLTGGDLIRRG